MLRGEFFSRIDLLIRFINALPRGMWNVVLTLNEGYVAAGCECNMIFIFRVFLLITRAEGDGVEIAKQQIVSYGFNTSVGTAFWIIRICIALNHFNETPNWLD